MLFVDNIKRTKFELCKIPLLFMVESKKVLGWKGPLEVI